MVRPLPDDYDMTVLPGPPPLGLIVLVIVIVLAALVIGAAR